MCGKGQYDVIGSDIASCPNDNIGSLTYLEQSCRFRRNRSLCSGKEEIHGNMLAALKRAWRSHVGYLESLTHSSNRLVVGMFR
jgi:hypothetical protein